MVDRGFDGSKAGYEIHLPNTFTSGRLISSATVYKDPLAVADAHSVPDSDLVDVSLIYPDRVGELYREA